MHAYMHAVICLRYMQTCLHACVQKFKRRCRIHTGSDRKTDRQTHRLAGRQTDIGTYRQTYIHTDRHTYIYICIYKRPDIQTLVKTFLHQYVQAGKDPYIYTYTRACMRGFTQILSFFSPLLVLHHSATVNLERICVWP